MKLKEIYQLAVDTGIEADARSGSDIDKQLRKLKENYDKLEGAERDVFDPDKLWNPYSDTRLLYGDDDREVSGILVGIDMEVSEVVLADRLREKGQAVDLVLAHHPEGKALADLAEVMGMQADLWAARGVPINVGDALIGGRMREVSRRLSPINHNRAVDAARLLDMPLMCVHTPTDNLVNRFVQEYVDSTDIDTPTDIVKKLLDIPEYSDAARKGAGPFVLVGDERTRAGQIHVDMTGGTEGPKEALSKLADAGIGTIVGMHMDDKLRKEAEKAKLNVVIAGHISSDTIGVNLFLDRLEERGLRITTTSGVIRISRSK